jgi:hypothetical protein
MIFFMIRDKRTNSWYKRGPYYSPNWVDQNEASVWTNLAGPNACMGKITRQNAKMARFGPNSIHDPEIVTFTVKSPKVATAARSQIRP